MLKLLIYNSNINFLKKDLDKKIIDILSSGKYILGNHVESFEKNISKFLGTKYVVSCNSGTDALVMSLRALDIGPGHEVITTPFTYFNS